MFLLALGSARVSSVAQAASGILKGAQRHILVPWGGKAQAFWLSQAQKYSGQKWDVGSFRLEQLRTVQPLDTAVLLCIVGQLK